MNKLTITHNGKEYEVNYAGDWIQNKVTETGTFFEANLLEQLKNKVRSFKAVVDVGANVGNHTYFFINVCQAEKVYAFEPVRDNFLICKANAPTARVYQAALSNYTGTTTLENNQSYNSGTSRMSIKEGDTPVLTLDSLELEDVTFIKVDVEGEELNAVEGMSRTILKYLPDLLVEVHYGITIEDVLSKMPVPYNFEDLGECHYFLKPVI